MIVYFVRSLFVALFIVWVLQRHRPRRRALTLTLLLACAVLLAVTFILCLNLGTLTHGEGEYVFIAPGVFSIRYHVHLTYYPSYCSYWPHHPGVGILLVLVVGNHCAT